MKSINSPLLSLASALSHPRATSQWVEKFLIFGTPTPSAKPHPLPLDLHEDSQNFIAILEVPGIQKSDLQIEAQNGQLHIWSEKTDRDASSHRTERLQRTLRLPEGLDPKSISARLEDGLLILTLPKPDAQLSIPISIA